jgi:hypothetical protein
MDMHNQVAGGDSPGRLITRVNYKDVDMSLIDEENAR